MGYTTDFTGEFKLSKRLLKKHRVYLEQFAYTRRMSRNPQIAETLPDPLREAAGLPIGPEGGFFVGEDKEGFGQGHDESVLKNNDPPAGQPGLWCKWVPNKDGTAICWNEAEKFYEYVDWLRYLIDNFLSSWGYRLNGVVSWQGEESSDIGQIVVDNSVVTTRLGRIVYD